MGLEVLFDNVEINWSSFIQAGDSGGRGGGSLALPLYVYPPGPLSSLLLARRSVRRMSLEFSLAGNSSALQQACWHSSHITTTIAAHGTPQHCVGVMAVPLGQIGCRYT